MALLKIRANQATDRANRWKPSEKDANGNRYVCYKKILFSELDKMFMPKSKSNDGKASEPQLKDYDIVEYPYTENMLLYLISRNYITDKKVTQASLEGLIEKVFERYHFTSSQGNISKALAELKKPFYYGTRDTLYTVVREGRRYLIKKHLAGLRANANEFARKYQKHLLFPTPFPLAASIYQEKKKQEEFVDVFIFRVDSDYAHAMKNDMFDLFDRNAFFNIIAYDDNVIVLLNRDYPHVLKLSKTIETLFSVTSPDATDQSTFTPEYIETDEDNVSSAD